MIFTSFPLVKKMFAVLMSRWTMPCSWAYWSPVATWPPSLATCGADSRLRSRRMRWSGMPSSSSIVM